jgi:hypothetical protein
MKPPIWSSNRNKREACSRTGTFLGCETDVRLIPVHFGLLFGASCLLLCGCGSNDPPMFHLKGTITFDGKPVKAGRVDFFTDLTQGNDGPQGYALIKDGQFDTRQAGQAHGGGAIVVRIEGFDGQAEGGAFFGTPIFRPYEIKCELPKEESEKNFDVPASAAEGFEPPPKSKS